MKLATHPAGAGIAGALRWRQGRTSISVSWSEGRELFYQLIRATVRARFITPIIGAHQ